jgi:iron complex transport system substrate-binding protein
MTLPSLSGFRKVPLALIVGTAALLGAVSWLAPVSGASKAARIDRTGPPIFTPIDKSWPRTVIDFDGYPVTMKAPAHRVVSQYWSIDDFVYTLLPPAEVVGVSESAWQKRISNVYQHVERFKPVVASDPERVLRVDPDLIIVSGSARVDFTALVRSTGIPIYRLATMFTTLDQVASTIRLVGHLSGQDERAEREYRRFLQVVKDARARKPAGSPAPRILGFGGRYSYGDETLFHDIVTTLGAKNVGAEGGLRGYDSVSTEQILRWDPEWIVVGADAGMEDAVRKRLMEDPAIALTQAARNNRILVYDQRVFLPMSPQTERILTQLGDDLYGR